MRALLPLLILFCVSAGAAEPDEILADPVLEARAAALDRELRCVVCQSQSIADSDADLAKEMRVAVRERLMAGDSDRQVLAYLVARYGDYVLLRPPVQANTLALWLFPGFVLVAGAAGAIIYLRRFRTAPPQPLSPDEKSALDALLNDDGAPPDLK